MRGLIECSSQFGNWTIKFENSTASCKMTQLPSLSDILLWPLEVSGPFAPGDHKGLTDVLQRPRLINILCRDRIDPEYVLDHEYDTRHLLWVMTAMQVIHGFAIACQETERDTANVVLHLELICISEEAKGSGRLFHTIVNYCISKNYALELEAIDPKLVVYYMTVVRQISSTAPRNSLMSSREPDDNLYPVSWAFGNNEYQLTA